MSSMLYPILFEPILKDKIWGGTRFETILRHPLGDRMHCGESWEVSGLVDDESVVANGFLAENNLNELLEIYLTELVGEHNYEKYGLGFPLLIKYIDAQDDLSVQVHPDDELANRKYGQSGKTEMWHVVAAEPGSGLYVGFNKKVTPQQYNDAVENNTLVDLLQFYPVEPGDTFMIPAGIVHAIGKGVLLAEVQQPSDVTFRIYDWDRVDEEGNPRKLHTDEAFEAIHFEENFGNFKVDYQPTINQTVSLVRSPFFNTSLIDFDQQVSKSFAQIDSFVIYMCLDGYMHLEYGEDEHIVVKTGDVVLVPADVDKIQLVPAKQSKVLEIYC